MHSISCRGAGCDSASVLSGLIPMFRPEKEGHVRDCEPECHLDTVLNNGAKGSHISAYTKQAIRVRNVSKVF